MHAHLFWTEIVASVVDLHLAQGRTGIVFGAHLCPDEWNEYIECLWVGMVTGRAVTFISRL